MQPVGLWTARRDEHDAADSLNCDRRQARGRSRRRHPLNSAVLPLLKVIMDEHGAVVFGGNGYSAEWHKMAVEERGLLNLPTCAEALPVLKEKYIEELFSKLGVLTPVELASRFEVYAEQYIRAIAVEARLVISMAKTSIYPAAMSYLSSLSDTLTKLSRRSKIEAPTEPATKVAGLAKSLLASVTKLEDALGKHDFDSHRGPPHLHRQDHQAADG